MRSSILPASALIMLLTLGSSACRKGDSTPEGPACSAEDSRPSTVTTTVGSRTESAPYSAEGLPPQYEQLASDTVRQVISSAQTNYYFFNANGDQHLTYQVIGGGSPVERIVRFYYSYDTDHRMIRRWAYSSTEAGPVDSVAYNWEDGNLVSMTDLLHPGRVLASYSYNHDGRGRNPGNTPAEASRWLHRKGSIVTLSKDYLSYSGGTYYFPAYDAAGRLIKLDASVEGTWSTAYAWTCR